jgi:hypothetical protein
MVRIFFNISLLHGICHQQITWYHIGFLNRKKRCPLKANLFMKQGKLFCLVFFCHGEIYQTTMFHPHPFVIFGKLLTRRGLFGPIVWKLLIIEPYSQWKPNKIETKKCIGIWQHSLCHWKALSWIKFNRVYFTIFTTEKILIFEWILLLEIQTNYKYWVWKEKSIEHSMCSHLGQQHRIH